MIFTKLNIPQINGRVVHRTNLFEKLNNGIEKKLVLVSASAGYGKTILLSDWIKQNKISAAWCSFDHRDNDPVEFLKVVVSSVHKQDNNIGNISLDLLNNPGTANIL